MLFVPQTSNLVLNISYGLVFLKMCYSWSQKVTGHMILHITNVVVVENVHVDTPTTIFVSTHHMSECKTSRSQYDRGLYHAPVIPAGIRSFLWNLAESSGIIFGRESCQNCHSGDHLFWWNRAIPELGPEWSWNGPEQNPVECWLHL